MGVPFRNTVINGTIEFVEPSSGVDLRGCVALSCSDASSSPIVSLSTLLLLTAATGAVLYFYFNSSKSVTKVCVDHFAG